MTPEIRTILQKMLVTYREADSYRDNGRVSIDRTSGRIQQITNMPSSITLKRPNQLNLVGGGQIISCDGKTLQIVLDGLGQYTSARAPNELTMDHVEIGAPGGGLDEGYPEVTAFLLGPDVYIRWIRRISRIELAGQETVADRLCHVVRYESIYRADIVMYIDAKDHVLVRCDMDVTRAQDPPNAPPRPPDEQITLKIRYDLLPVQINQEIDESAFAVVPPKRARLVSRFQNQAPDEQSDAAPDVDQAVQQRFVGQKIPSIQGTDLDGKPLTPADLQGRVTLLFLWSPEGGPDCLRAVQLVQRVADRFRSHKTLTILSISGAANRPEMIRDLLKAKKADYRTLLDEDDLIMREFGIEGLPLFFVVSRDQVVRNAWYGAPLERETQIADALTAELSRAEAGGK